MAKLPSSVDSIIDQFGPHKGYTPKEGFPGVHEPDKLVKTHCCFCGMQCGIQLKVKDNKVTGFEPWMEFPFNEGRLCPKGVQRYLQNNHPDRLLAPYKRVEGKGFERTSWEEAMSKTVSEIQRIQNSHGRDAFAMLSGVSLTNEKSYMVGKFARVALKTANLDYNGRLCMVSAGAGNKKAFGLDRISNTWEDLKHAEVIIIAGTNVSETFPTLTHYIWQARDNGAKLIVIDPRVTPIARTADLHLPVRPGGDSALFGAMLKILVDNDWLDHDFIDNYTSGFQESIDAVKDYDLAWAEEKTGISAAKIQQAAEWWGKAKTSFLLHARGIEHHSKGVDNVLSCINLVLATGRIGRPYCGYGTITGQGNGQGGREHGHKCDQLPGNRDITNPEHRKYISEVWGIDEKEMPGKGLSAYEIIEAIHRGEIKGLITICFNPLVSLPNNNFVREAFEKLEYYVAIDFFLNETARHADLILPGSLHEEEEGTVTTAEGRVVKINQAVTPPGEARKDSDILIELAQRLGVGDKFAYKKAEDTFNELRVASKGGTADYFGITYEKIEKNMGVFWPCPSEDHPGTPRLWEDKKFKTPDGKAHFNPVPYREPSEVVDKEYPVVMTTGRVVSQYLSGSQTRRIGKLVDQYPEPLLEIHPKLAYQYGIKDGDEVMVKTRRGEAVFPAQLVETIREDTVFIPYHWGGKQSANQLTIGTLDPVSKIPEFKVCACKLVPTGKIASIKIKESAFQSF
ncbi:MAG: molybdopterin oxidoreductase family protein [Algoriphagus sp.]|jgi:assimilatory nitrate reductase catalytic subunit|uniref:molybdopterin oxidoreductase family protein n=1 Tax=Algoriphagus sp. TaxID=1872435 RepID=UPI002724CE56|nr:molybdopterin oxidoreductase family protein [Algoriphagus sp.]MDO8965137.1 molybdopterin oxidoreductase family protein [Algoriphagus sp.]MDP2043282.1 molybdopterin oxidoreductase family protein [Algoriphagus sp.]MDP3199211.1 molybdopterin oxidoreductase family protein [Algoriphagus sp.]MDP3471192.1 molybdopterin oxidoreductase family protein [Algoriphagus sp.]